MLSYAARRAEALKRAAASRYQPDKCRHMRRHTAKLRRRRAMEQSAETGAIRRYDLVEGAAAFSRHRATEIAENITEAHREMSADATCKYSL